jgi:hypothetical protein
MTVPHRDNVPSPASRCPNQHDEAIVQQPVGLKPLFAIVEPIIALGQQRPREHLRRIGEVETASLKGRITLRLMEGDLHQIES